MVNNWEFIQCRISVGSVSSDWVGFWSDFYSGFVQTIMVHKNAHECGYITENIDESCLFNRSNVLFCLLKNTTQLELLGIFIKT